MEKSKLYFLGLIPVRRELPSGNKLYSRTELCEMLFALQIVFLYLSLACQMAQLLFVKKEVKNVVSEAKSVLGILAIVVIVLFIIVLLNSISLGDNSNRFFSLCVLPITSAIIIPSCSFFIIFTWLFETNFSTFGIITDIFYTIWMLINVLYQILFAFIFPPKSKYEFLFLKKEMLVHNKSRRKAMKRWK
jgi:hypothetical protein